jgi:hypothetical protein
VRRRGESTRPCRGVAHGYNAFWGQCPRARAKECVDIIDPEGFGRRLSDMDAMVADASEDVRFAE